MAQHYVLKKGKTSTLFCGNIDSMELEKDFSPEDLKECPLCGERLFIIDNGPLTYMNKEDYE